jgi:hypothetical protein
VGIRASAYGLKLDAYEAGEDTTGSLNISAKQQAVLDPQNTAIIEKFLNLWYSAGGNQLNWYTIGARSFNTQFGSWSITDDATNYNEPKEQAYLAIENQGTAAPAPTADAYVRDGSYASQNYGSSTQLLVKDATPGGGYVRTSYLQFNLAGVSTVTSAFLQLYGAEQAGSSESSITIGAYPVAGSAWSEGTITDANAPAVGTTAITTVSVAGTTTQEYIFDLTSYIQQQLLLGKTSITIALQGTAYTNGTVVFNSREAATLGPQLFIGVPAPTPVVTRVSVGSTQWSSGFTYANGYAVPTGAAQLTDLPWINLNQVSITFNEAVNVAQGDLSVSGVSQPSYAIGGFSYNAATFTATWTFAAPLGDDRLQLDLAATGANAVTSTSGIALDGTWNNGVSAFPSGAGAPGTDFKYDLNVLPGDAVQTGGPVNVLELVKVRNAQTAMPGDAQYSPFYDLDGSGSITVLDVIDVRNRQLSSLPAGTP